MNDKPTRGMPRSTTIHNREVAHQVISRALEDDRADTEERGIQWDHHAAATAALDALEAEASISTGNPLVLVVGSPADGLTFYGPYANGDDVDAEQRDLRNNYWWLVEIQPPLTGEDT